MFFKKKTLLEQDPKALSLEQLELLHRALVAKMVLVNVEFKTRYLALMAASDGLSGNSEFKATFSQGVEKMERLNAILEGGPPVLMAIPAETLGLAKR